MPRKKAEKEEEVDVAAPKKRNKWKWLNLLLFIIVIVIGTLFFRAEQERRNALNELEAIDQSTEEEESGEERAKRVIESVQKHIRILTDPEPTVATIVDIEKLQEASVFYAPAKNGDNLIITASKAILYDPDEDILLNVAVIRANQDDAESGPATSVKSSPKPSPTPDEEVGEEIE